MISKNTCSLKPLVPYFDIPRPIDWQKQFSRNAPIEVEIGFGMGEVLLRSAKEHKDRVFIGIEQHWERIFKSLSSISREGISQYAPSTLDNIKILHVDAHIAFRRFFQPKSISKIVSLFPCPWPKKGHVKHRLFSDNFLKLLNSRLVDGGIIQIVTDFLSYHEWVCKQLPQTGFEVETTVIKPKFNTKFERKWTAEGQEEFYEMSLKKVKHVSFPIEEDIVLKGYRVKHFNPDQFAFDDVLGNFSVIFKNLIFDSKQSKAMIHLLVVEQHLNQHIWIEVKQKKDHWRIARADGQNFFPTPGIAQAIELVYKAVEAKN